MKRNLILFAVAIFSLISFNVSAEVVSPDMAKTTADNLMSLDGDWKGASDATVRLVEKGGVPAYYVVEYNGGGWALISAQSSSNPYIGYNTTGTYAEPEPMKQLLDLRAERIVLASKEEVEHDGWELAMKRKPAKSTVSSPDIAPLIPITLSQSDPYNKYCPTIDGSRTLVGCVAVAGTQAMMIHQYPEKGEGKYTYTDPGTGSHTINFDNEEPYDWNAVLTCKETGDYDETARILYHVGVASDMSYNLYFSGTTVTDIYDALYRNFRYDKNNLELSSRDYFSDEEWLEKIIKDLTLGRAVIYVGAANEAGEGGHCWNVDGWKDATQMIHCNWGWNGSGDGYFDINNLHDKYQGIDLNFYHGAIFGVGAPTTAPYSILLSKTKFVEGTPANTVLADVTVLCEDDEAVIEYELFGPKNVLQQHTTSPYYVENGKLLANKVVANTNAFKYLKMKVTNAATGESYEREFNIQINSNDAVESVLSNDMRVYPSVTTRTLTIETPTAGGEYAIYNVAGAQVAAGEMNGYKQEIEVSNLAAGTYILRYVHANGVGVKTFIKK